MAYEKADFAAAYRKYAVDPVTNHRYANFKSPETGLEPLTCILHYHPNAIKPSMVQKAERLVQHYIDNGTPLIADSTVCVIGGAFGWLGEALEDLVPGLEACSVDLSQYVQDVKAVSADDELIEQLEASGYDITVGGGKRMYDLFKNPSPRCRRPEMVVQSSLQNNKARNDVRKLFQKLAIDHVITEELWQILTPEEKTRYTAAADSYGATLTHIIDEVII